MFIYTILLSIYWKFHTFCIYNGFKIFEEWRIKHAILKQAHWKQDLTLVPDIFQPERGCISICLSSAKLASHMKFQDCKQSVVI